VLSPHSLRFSPCGWPARPLSPSLHITALAAHPHSPALLQHPALPSCPNYTGSIIQFWAGLGGIRGWLRESTACPPLRGSAMTKSLDIRRPVGSCRRGARFCLRYHWSLVNYMLTCHQSRGGSNKTKRLNFRSHERAPTSQPSAGCIYSPQSLPLSHGSHP
jgi:hypothetical protein